MRFTRFKDFFTWMLNEDYRQVEAPLTTEEDRRQIGFIAGYQCNDCKALIHPSSVSTYRHLKTGSSIYAAHCKKCGFINTHNRR